MTRPILPDVCEEHGEAISKRVRNVATKYGDENCNETRIYDCGCTVSVNYVGHPMEWQVTSEYVLRG